MTRRRVKSLILQWLFTIARSRVGGWIIGWSFRYMSAFIPVERLHETPTLIAFYHPRPSYHVHILLVPKRTIPNMDALTAEHCDFLIDVFATVTHLVAELNLAQAGYRLMCNGGASQDVPHLHFHLISDAPIA